LTFAAIGRFYLPLALTSVLSMALIPLGTFGLARGAFPVESLAVWPVAGSMIFLFRSGGIAFQEVAIALAGTRREHERVLRRTAAWLAAGASLSLALVVLTPPLAVLWFQRISGLSERLTAVAALPVRILILFPALEYLLSIQRARWILSRHTTPITIATAIEFAGLGAGLFVTVGALDMIGAVGAAIGMLIGRLAANGFLLIAARLGSARGRPASG
jgi:hypothetical protein